MAYPGGMEVVRPEPPVQIQDYKLVAVAYHPAWLLKTIDVSCLAAWAAFPHIISYTYDPLRRPLRYIDGLAEVMIG
jgi:hypothetical protein